MNYDEKIKELKIELPEAKAPVGSYVATKISGNLLYVSGQISINSNGEFRYFHELHEKFMQPERVIAYVIAFVFLSLHLLHGFQSSFQSVGFSNQNKRQILHKIGNVFAVVVPLGFVFIAIFHFLNQHH